MAIQDPDVPSPTECTDAVTRALRRQINLHREELPRVSSSYLQEQVTALAVRPEPSDDGWWRIGVIFDYIYDSQYNIWYRPRGLALSQIPQPIIERPAPTMLAEPAYEFRSYVSCSKP